MVQSHLQTSVDAKEPELSVTGVSVVTRVFIHVNKVKIMKQGQQLGRNFLSRKKS